MRRFVMNQTTVETMSEFLKMTLAKEHTSVSYAMMVEGEVVACDALGWQDKPSCIPAGTDCTYNVASVSKIYCTAAVMILVQRHLVDLDRPVVDYVPDFTMLDENYRKITVRHCLNHASGLPGTQWNGFSVTEKTGRDYEREILDYFSKCYLKDEPGKYSVYCNDGFALAQIVVSRVSGQSYASFVQENITDPIQAYSTRLIETQNEKYPLVHENKKKAELLFCEGAAGMTTTMIDLCRFGQLFLEKNDILSEESKAEMARLQGVSFVEGDQKSVAYGLGWDTVRFSHPYFDLGEGVLLKGGNSFQFTTQFMIVPKYHAVLAISETHDCAIDTNQAILHLFAQWMLKEKGVSIYRSITPIPENQKKYCGTYLMPSMILDVAMEGGVMNICERSADGKQSTPFRSYLRYDGSHWVMNETEQYYFMEAHNEIYLMSVMNGISYPAAMKCHDFAALSDVWKERLNKKYIVTDCVREDMVIGDIMGGFECWPLEEAQGVIIASFSGRAGSDIYSGGFNASFIPVDDEHGKGFLNTPCNGSRDMIYPHFFEQDGISYCDVNSYRYESADCLSDYQGQDYKDHCCAYRIVNEVDGDQLKRQGHRVMILDKDLNVIADSEVDEKLKKVSEGYLLLI